ARALAAGRQALGPELLEPKLLPQRQRQPARSPLPRPAQPQRRQLQPDNRGVRQDPFAAVLRKQRQAARARALLIKNLDGLAPRHLLRAVDFTQVENMLLNDPAPRDALVLDNAPV